MGLALVAHSNCLWGVCMYLCVDRFLKYVWDILTGFFYSDIFTIQMSVQMSEVDFIKGKTLDKFLLPKPFTSQTSKKRLCPFGWVWPSGYVHNVTAWDLSKDYITYIILTYFWWIFLQNFYLPPLRSNNITEQN